MQLPDDIEQRLLDGQLDRAATDLANRRKIAFAEATKLIRCWVSDGQHAIQGSGPYSRRGVAGARFRSPD